MKPTEKFNDLIELVGILRNECPWDRKQTHESIKDNLIEEAYEVIEAIDQKNFEELRKELGDLLLHVVFHAIMAEEKDKFDMKEVIFTLQAKLIRRHPHVFEDAEVTNEQEVAENWESIKKKEGKSSVLEGIPPHLPALIRALRMQEKASNIGFDWPNVDNVWEKIEEELEELKTSVDTGNSVDIEKEFGDLLFSMVNLGRFLGVNAEDSLRYTNSKFETRFKYIEQKFEHKDKSLQEADIEEMDRYWEEAKTQKKS